VGGRGCDERCSAQKRKRCGPPEETNNKQGGGALKSALLGSSKARARSQFAFIHRERGTPLTKTCAACTGAARARGESRPERTSGSSICPAGFSCHRRFLRKALRARLSVEESGLDRADEGRALHLVRLMRFDAGLAWRGCARPCLGGALGEWRLWTRGGEELPKASKFPRESGTFRGQ
jgi:hypothetical protein